MHATAQGFLDAICCEPADDTPRLIYADWLEDEGEAERAEFIRLQIEIATWGNLSFEVARKASKLIERWQKGAPVQMHGRTPACKLLREHVLLSDPHNFCSWVPLLLHQGSGVGIRCVKPPVVEITGGWCKQVKFSRGFPSHVTLSESAFLQHCEAIFRAAPITSVTLGDKEPMNIQEQGTMFSWFDATEWTAGPRQPEDLDAKLFAALTGGWTDNTVEHKNREYSTRGDAIAALSLACVSLARQRAGLPALAS